MFDLTSIFWGKKMEYSLATQLIAEFIGTAFMVLLGNGSVANVELEGTKGHHAHGSLSPLDTEWV